ncbi:MAG: filamentous hemagglutinin, partial [Trichodesmium sp. St7_bin2_1]|nr:filamentous hemagglutinin [Trichodesmium sp. St7_bin2_1]
MREGTSLTTETDSAGKAGDIRINSEIVTIGKGAEISATALEGATNTEAGGGKINIKANELNISGQLGIFAQTQGEAPAGKLTLKTYNDTPDLDINFSNKGFISASTTSTGSGGNIDISAPLSINITGDGEISVKTTGSGDAGTINIKTQNLTTSDQVSITASTRGDGNAGAINIDTNTFDLTTGTSLTTETNSAGKAGDISINSETLKIGKDARLSATAKAGATNTEVGGNITIKANNLEISGKLGIFAETAGKSPAGNLTLNPYKNDPNLDKTGPNLNITFTEEGFISARTTSIGDGGNINIKAPENINLQGKGKISVETTGQGNAGTIDIQTQKLNLSDQVVISAETNSPGQAGNIEINSQTVTIGQGTKISATAGEKATNTEGGGNITINSNQLDISGELGIFAETAGESPAGTLTLNPYKNDPNLDETGPNLNITFTEKGFISARTTSIGDGGNNNIKAPENINLQGEGKISVETTGQGNAGTIDIQTQNLNLSDKVAISAETNS